MPYDTNVVPPDPSTGRDVYRQHARTWLQANLPTHMRADHLDYRPRPWTKVAPGKRPCTRPVWPV